MPVDLPLLLVRLLALALGAIHLTTLIANLAQSLDRLNPAYLGHFARQHLVRPFVGVAIAALLLASARPLAVWLGP